MRGVKFAKFYHAPAKLSFDTSFSAAREREKLERKFIDNRNLLKIEAYLKGSISCKFFYVHAVEKHNEKIALGVRERDSERVREMWERKKNEQVFCA